MADSLTKYPLAARGGRGPDVIQFPHDNLGRFAAAGVIGSSPSGFAIDKALYAPVATQAITYKGKVWGLPIARETTFLFYNKALIAQPPKTWTQLIAAAKKLTSGEQYGFLWAPADFYYDYAFIGGYGGFVFQSTKNGFNGRRLGLATPGAIAGFQLIQDLVQKHKLVPATTNYDIMDGKFGSGQAAMIINGPWGVQNYASKKINFGVAPLPDAPERQGSDAVRRRADARSEQPLEERSSGVGPRPLPEHQPAAAAVPGVGTGAGDGCRLEREGRSRRTRSRRS